MFICIIKTNCITIICESFTRKEEHELFTLQKTCSEYDLFWCYRAGLKFEIWAFKHLVDKTKIKDGSSIHSRQIKLSLLSFRYCTWKNNLIGHKNSIICSFFINLLFHSFSVSFHQPTHSIWKRNVFYLSQVLFQHFENGPF